MFDVDQNLAKGQSKEKFEAAQLLQVQNDLKRALETFPNKNIGIKMLSEKIELSDRTLKRILKGTHRPTYQSILKIYRYLRGTKDDRETIMEMPEILLKYTTSEYDNFFLTDKETSFSHQVASYLEKDSAFRAIYVETATGPLSREKVVYEYGRYGIQMLKKMAQMDVIKEIKGGFYIASSKRAALNESNLYEIAKFLLEQKYFAEKANLKGENFCHVLFDGIDKETYNKILEVDWIAMKKKIDLIKKTSKGPIKFWSIYFTDTLSPSCIYDETSKDPLQ